MNHLDSLRTKFADEIVRYGIRSVYVRAGRVDIESDERIPYELFASIECELL